jgi:two-component system response regulator FixJ
MKPFDPFDASVHRTETPSPGGGSGSITHRSYDHGVIYSERLAEQMATLRARCSELISNLELCRTGSERVYEAAHELRKQNRALEEFRERFRSLTSRQRDVLERISRGEANKLIAFDLHVSQKTVETHRARLMRKLRAESFADLIRCYIMAFGFEGDVPQIRPASRAVSPAPDEGGSAGGDAEQAE